MFTWGSMRVTQKWEPHVVSSCVWVEADEVEGWDCLGLPFMWTSGVGIVLATCVFFGREMDETSDVRGLAGL
jgi:hypothetical protein